MEKRLDEMNRLADMGQFPALVNAGATLNVMVTMAVTWWVEPRWPGWVGVWVGLVIAANLTPVVLLRLLDDGSRPMNTVRGMDFVKDQHRFSDWVYVAASANMMVWVLMSWTAAALHRTTGLLVALEVVAAVVTFSPVLVRGLRRG